MFVWDLKQMFTKLPKDCHKQGVPSGFVWLLAFPDKGTRIQNFTNHSKSKSIDWLVDLKVCYQWKLGNLDLPLSVPFFYDFWFIMTTWIVWRERPWVKFGSQGTEFTCGHAIWFLTCSRLFWQSFCSGLKKQKFGSWVSNSMTGRLLTVLAGVTVLQVSALTFSCSLLWPFQQPHGLLVLPERVILMATPWVLLAGTDYRAN